MLRGCRALGSHLLCPGPGLLCQEIHVLSLHVLLSFEMLIKEAYTLAMNSDKLVK